MYVYRRTLNVIWLQICVGAAKLNMRQKVDFKVTFCIETALADPGMGGLVGRPIDPKYR